MIYYRLLFTKDESVKYISHLDTMRAISRALRRSGLDNAYTEGFNPHTVLSLMSPLAVGISSDAEIAEIAFNNETDEREIENKLNAVMPYGMKILKAVKKPLGDKRQIFMADYEIWLEGVFPSQGIGESLMELHEITMIKTGKKGDKEVDIKPLIISLKEMIRGKNEVKLSARLRAGNETLKPELLVKAIDKYLAGASVFFHKAKRISLLDESGSNII